jgi:Zn-dependent peptidase ImmA (M78 family)
MKQVDDPGYREIRREFLAYVREFHERNDFTRDWQALCQELNIVVGEADLNLYARHGGQSSILVDPTQPENRLLFTALHELSHYLFRETEEGFIYLLEEHYEPDVAKELEERLCNEAASVLLFPDHELKSALRGCGVSPDSAFALTSRGGSLAAALVRILQAHDHDLWGLILRRDRRVEFTWTTTRFNLGRDHYIEESHPIHDAWHGPIELAAPLPYASGFRKVKKRMRAGANNRRLVALFAPAFRDPPDERQPALFANFF